MDPASMRSQRGKKSAYRVSELDVRKRNNAVEESLRAELSNLNERERQSVRSLQNQTRNFLDSIQTVKLGRRKVNKSLTRNHNPVSRSRSGSLTSVCPRPRTCLADTYREDELSDDTEVVKLPSINIGPAERYRSLMRPSSSALQRRRFSENDALVESLRRFHALRIDNQKSGQKDEIDSSSSSQPPQSQPPKAKVRGRSGSCFGRLISSPSTFALDIKEDKNRDDDTRSEYVNEVENEVSENDIAVNFIEPSAGCNDDTKPHKNENIYVSFDKGEDLNDDNVSTNHDISVEQIVPQIVITEYENSSSSMGSLDNIKDRQDSNLLRTQVKRRPSRIPSAKSDWSRNRPLREARKKNMALLPSTFAALSMSRRFSSPDPAEDAVKAHQMFLEKLNRRRRSEQSELSQRVNDFLKQIKPSAGDDFTSIDREVSSSET
ncbi:hypothetical protein HOLleu_20547 [Holothuria leucospilota]|uniref:Uncharacterized protein n=1 Tax=Holothuria leucospilota TaxID=206669 RepID=A0A9Q1H8J4_HOLLE|nr:hypothetical protein HOLleu_20547 [Holothuria leucospilota]